MKNSAPQIFGKLNINSLTPFIINWVPTQTNKKTIILEVASMPLFPINRIMLPALRIQNYKIIHNSNGIDDA